MNNGYWEDDGPPDRVTYRQAILWLLWNDRLLWVDHGRDPSRAASIIADMFKRSVDELRDDVRSVRAAQGGAIWKYETRKTGLP